MRYKLSKIAIGRRYGLQIFGLLLWAALMTVTSCGSHKTGVLKGRTICIDPGHGGTAATDSFRVGPTGEREEWIDLRVSLMLADLLKKDGASVILTRKADKDVGLKARADLAIARHADLFISVHHNATADSSVNIPIIYFHGNASENQASVEFAKRFAREIRFLWPNGNIPVSITSDFVIFPTSGASVLRNSYGIPGIIGEASFFSNPAEELRLKDREHNKQEALAYHRAILNYFTGPQLPVLELKSRVSLPPFPVFQEAGRMDPLALKWQEDYEEGCRLAVSDDPDSLALADSLLTRSVRYFPDSWLAGDAHLQRSRVLAKMGRTAEAEEARQRCEEHYVPMEK